MRCLKVLNTPNSPLSDDTTGNTKSDLDPEDPECIYDTLFLN